MKKKIYLDVDSSFIYEAPKGFREKFKSIKERLMKSFFLLSPINGCIEIVGVYRANSVFVTKFLDVLQEPVEYQRNDFILIKSGTKEYWLVFVEKMDKAVRVKETAAGYDLVLVSFNVEDIKP